MILRYGGLGSAFAECMGDLCRWAESPRLIPRCSLSGPPFVSPELRRTTERTECSIPAVSSGTGVSISTSRTAMPLADVTADPFK